MDKIEKVREHIEEIMKILEVPINNSTEDTPKRVAKMWCNEVFENINNTTIDKLNASMKVFDNIDNLEDMVVLRDIHFNSMCEHHFMPFFGKMAVAYVPNNKIIGLSKIPRVIKYFSKKPQLQERLVKEIADYLVEIINPKALFVMAYDTTHTCVLCRGIECEADTDTMYKKFDIFTDNELKSEYIKEFYNRIGGK